MSAKDVFFIAVGIFLAALNRLGFSQGTKMPESTVFIIGVICGAFILAVVELIYIWLLRRDSRPADEDAA